VEIKLTERPPVVVDLAFITHLARDLQDSLGSTNPVPIPVRAVSQLFVHRTASRSSFVLTQERLRPTF